MRRLDPDDNGSRVRRHSRSVQPSRSDKTRPATRSGDDHREPRADRPSGVRGDEARIEGNRYRRSQALDRDPDTTESNPAAASDQVRRSSSSARDMTDGAPRFGSADAAEHHAQVSDSDHTGDETHPFAAPASTNPNPSEDAEAEPQPDPGEAVVPGAEVPPVPDFAHATPTEPPKDNPVSGTYSETFEVDGVRYERTTDRGGQVRVSYEVNGVSYTNTTQEDGRQSTLATLSDDDGVHSRTVQHDAQGNLIDDTTVTTQGETDPDTGDYNSSTETVRLTPDGTRTTTEVDSVNGQPRSYSSEIRDPEGQTRRASLDVPENLDPEQFTEQLANFAANGDPTLLATAVSGLDREQLRGVIDSVYSAEDQSGFYDFLQAAQAASAVGGPGATNAFAGALHDTITDENLINTTIEGPAVETLRDAFYGFAAEGGDAALGVELIDRLLTTSDGDDITATLANEALQGHNNFGSGLVDGVVTGLYARSNGFGQAADRVDQLNQDLSYLTLNYAPFMTDAELAAAQDEFRQTHADEYADFEAQSAGIVANVDNIQRLDEMMRSREDDYGSPFLQDQYDFENLNDNVLTRVRQASATRQGRAELTTELQEAGRGRPSFLQDLDGLAGDSDDDQRQLAILRNNIMDTAISSSAGAAAVGDTESSREVLDGLGVADPEIPTEAISLLEELSGGAADLNDLRLSRLEEVLDASSIDSAMSGKLRNAGAILGLAGLVADGVEIFSGDANAETYIDTLANGTELGTEVFEQALSRTFSNAGVQTAGKIAGGVGVLLSAVGAVEALSEGDFASAGLNVAAAIGGALTLSSSAAATGVGAVITVAAIAGQIGLAQYRKVEASNHFESGDTERFVSHALAGANLTEDQENAVLHELRNADSEGRLTGILFAQAAQQAGIEPSDFLTQIARLGPNAVHDIVTQGHGVDPGDEGVADLKPSEVAEFLEYVQDRYGVAT